MHERQLLQQLLGMMTLLYIHLLQSFMHCSLSVRLTLCLGPATTSILVTADPKLIAQHLDVVATKTRSYKLLQAGQDPGGLPPRGAQAALYPTDSATC